MAARAATAHPTSQTDKEPRKNENGPCGAQLDCGHCSAEQNHHKGAKDEAGQKGYPPGKLFPFAAEEPAENAADAGYSTVQKDKQGRRPADKKTAEQAGNRREIFDVNVLPICMNDRQDIPGRRPSDRFGSISRFFSSGRV